MTNLEILVVILVVVAIIVCVIMMIDSVNNESGKGMGFSFVLIALLVWIGGSLLTIRNNNIEESKYRLKNYKLEYEIITRGEESDTLYVLTRKFQK